MKCYGLNQGYTQFGISLFDMHDQWLPPPPMPLKFAPGLFEGPAFMGWHPTRAVTHKVGKKTFYDGNNAIQQGHDVGYLVLHLAMPPNVMMAINTVLSKHKVMIPITRVLIEGKLMGTYLAHFLSLICSQPVSLPTGFLVHCSGTVVTKATMKDLVMGLVFIAVDMLIDALWSLVMKGDAWNIGRSPLKPSNWNRAPRNWIPNSMSMPSWLKMPWYKGRLDRIWNPKMAADAGRALIWRQWWNKAADHLVKSWIVSPLLQGAGFQAAQPATGLPRTALPSIAVGRGSLLNARFFPFPMKVFGANVTN
jgi:hypothetical protein